MISRFQEQKVLNTSYNCGAFNNNNNLIQF